MIAFSLAGTDERGDAIRRGTRSRQVTEAIRTLERTKGLLCSTGPAVHLAYLLLQSHRQEVQGLPALMQDLNVRHAVISTLDFVAAPALAAEAVLPATPEAYETARSELEEVAQAGRRAGLSIHYRLASPPESEARRRACGSAAVPAPGATHLVGSTERAYAGLDFGNTHDTPFERIWRSRPYAVFRAAHRRGELPERCRDCPRPRMLRAG